MLDEKENNLGKTIVEPADPELEPKKEVTEKSPEASSEDSIETSDPTSPSPSSSIDKETVEDTQTKGPDVSPVEPTEVESDNPSEASAEASEDVQQEIDASNAEDAEDSENQQRHHIPVLDYHSMSMENLVGELQRLVRNEKIQAIKRHVDGIKHEFDLKFQEFIETKKEEFISNGGHEIDFRYNSVTKRQFNEVYADYREKRNQYYKNLEKQLKENLAKRLEIIEELKGLINVEEDINTTYKNFRELQENWRNAGPVPRNSYNDVWRTYQHHIEIFYDFLHLNRELRDLDFKHNLEEKQKLAAKAEALVEEKDLNKAFRELQTLHKLWKEETGPVAKEHREDIWERFSNATKAMHQRRQEHYKQLEELYEQNLEKKSGIIAEIDSVAANVANNHKMLQQQIRQIEELRERFFKAGKVPQKVNEETWARFKEAVRAFNRNKNSFYKNLKKEQHENLNKKRALLQIATSLKDSEDWDTATQEMKRIQSEWKKIGHVPRRYSDKIWKEFKSACNHYFDRLHASKNSVRKAEQENLEKKLQCLDKLKDFQLGGNRKEDLAKVKSFIDEWRSYGQVPFKRKNINQKFNKVVDALLRKLKVSHKEAELLKYGNKIKELSKKDSGSAINNERTFIRRKITESKNELRQLETNMQFFSNASEDSPVVKEVLKNIEAHKEALETWNAKLKRLNILENKLNREATQAINDESVSTEEE